METAKRKGLKRATIFGGAALAASAVFLYAAFAPRAGVEAAFEGEPQLVAATFSSAWCAPCRIVKPRLARAIPDFEDAPVKFVEYDFTFDDAEFLREKAAADGLGDAFDRFAPATGYTLLVKPASGEIVGMLTADHSTDAMRAAIARALESPTESK